MTATATRRHMALDHQVWRLAQARVALVTTLGSVLAGSALRAVGLEGGGWGKLGSSGVVGGRVSSSILASSLSDASGELDYKRLEPGDSLALGEDDVDELFFGEREQCRTIIHAARVANQSAERCTSVKFVSRL
ncbi:MAG: hypothetical protein U0821_20935 [Chloroflexota bacterium]